jgi:hypothetical protein
VGSTAETKKQIACWVNFAANYAGAQENTFWLQHSSSRKPLRGVGDD